MVIFGRLGACLRSKEHVMMRKLFSCTHGIRCNVVLENFAKAIWAVVGVTVEYHCPWRAAFCRCDGQQSPLFQQNIIYLILPNQYSLWTMKIARMVNIFRYFL